MVLPWYYCCRCHGNRKNTKLIDQTQTYKYCELICKSAKMQTIFFSSSCIAVIGKLLYKCR